LLGSFLISELGDGITAVVVSLGVYALSDSVVALAGTFLGRLLLGSAFAAVGGSVADRFDRRRVILLSYVLRAVLVGVLIALSGTSVVGFAVLGLAVGAAGSFDNPAAEASLRAAYRHDLQSLAAARKSGRTLSGLVGPAVGGVLFEAGGLTVALGVNVVTFVLAAAILYPHRFAVGVATSGRPDPPRRTLRIRAIMGAPGLAKLAFISALGGSFLVAFAVVLAVPYLDQLPSSPAGAYGYSLAAYSIGALLGLWLASLANWSQVTLKMILIPASMTYGLLVMLSVASTSWLLFALAWALWGLCFGPEEVVADARVAVLIPDEWLGRVYAWWAIVGKFGAALAYASVMLLETTDPRATLLAVGLAYLCLMPLILALPRETRGTATPE
jgi:MFS family permease